MEKGKKRDMVPQGNATSDTEYDDDGNIAEREDCRSRTISGIVGKLRQFRGVEKFHLNAWNRRKVACGVHRTTFCTYLGVLVHEHVDINYSGVMFLTS